jgi:DNA-binding transcriptional regulator YiaG
MSASHKTSPVQQLREIKARHSLTNADIAGLAGVSVKAVESWLASETAASRRSMAGRHMMLIRASLPLFLARRGRGD